MSVIQAANLHFESTSANRIVYTNEKINLISPNEIEIPQHLKVNGINVKSTIIAAFSAANTALPNTSDVSFNGSLNFPTGNVGIGISNPALRLHVYTTNANTTNGVYISGGGGATRFVQISPALGPGNYNPIVSAGDSGIIYGTQGAQSNGALVIAPWASGTSGVRFDSSGNVGIGTTTVPAQLTIVGAGQAVVSNFNTANTLAGTILVGSSGTAAQDGGAIVFSAASTAWRFAAIKGHVLNGTSNTVGDITFQTRRVSTDPTLTETLRVSYTGNVLIGRTDSTVGLGVKLDVNGSINVAALYVNGAPLQSGATIFNDAANATRYVTFVDATSGTMLRANVGTALTYNPSTGTLSSTLFNSTSDINKKENIVQVTDALNILYQIDGVRFTWKDNGLPSLGVIAQQVEKVLPEIVESEKSVNYNGLIAVLIEAVKELKAEIEKLKKNR